MIYNINIEILGKDTTKVQFNYFTDSRGDHEFFYDLGFDASEDFHDYAFDDRKMPLAAEYGNIRHKIYTGVHVKSVHPIFCDLNLLILHKLYVTIGYISHYL